MSEQGMKDDHSITVGDRAVGLLGPVSSSFTLAWLAAHRGRLRTLMLGGHRLSVLVVWDRKGREVCDHSEDEVKAMARLVYGPREGGDTEA